MHQADADMECVLRMCLDLAALQRLAAPGSVSAPAFGKSAHAVPPANEPPPGAVQSHAHSSSCGSNSISTSLAAGNDVKHTADSSVHPPLPALSFSDFQLLQCHPVAVSERDAQQWRKGLTFLQAALQRNGWSEPPSLV